MKNVFTCLVMVTEPYNSQQISWKPALDVWTWKVCSRFCATIQEVQKDQKANVWRFVQMLEGQCLLRIDTGHPLKSYGALWSWHRRSLLLPSSGGSERWIACRDKSRSLGERTGSYRRRQPCGICSGFDAWWWWNATDDSWFFNTTWDRM